MREGRGQLEHSLAERADSDEVVADQEGVGGLDGVRVSRILNRHLRCTALLSAECAYLRAPFSQSLVATA